MDLGRKSKSPGAVPEPAGGEEPKISYPGLSLSDEAADAFTKECDSDLGETITATVKLKVTGKRQDEYGNSVSFDVLSLDNIQADEGAEPGAEAEGVDKEPAEGAEPEAEAEVEETPEEKDASAAEEKALGYKRPKSKKPTPNLSAKTLLD